MKSEIYFDFENGNFYESSKEKIVFSEKKYKDLKSIFLNPEDERLDAERVLYEVACHLTEEKEGDLSFGVTKIYPGTVNNEFFMTKGHYHEKMSRTEYYWGIKGRGLLLLLNKNGECRAELVEKNSLNYIPRDTAHRLVNISDEEFLVGACWNTDAGHDYDTIQKYGFPMRVFKIENGYEIIEKK